MTNNTPTAGPLDARKAARAARIAKAAMVEDVADAKVLLQNARDYGITVEDANYLRSLVESIITATSKEEDGTPTSEALEPAEAAEPVIEDATPAIKSTKNK